MSKLAVCLEETHLNQLFLNYSGSRNTTGSEKKSSAGFLEKSEKSGVRRQKTRTIEPQNSRFLLVPGIHLLTKRRQHSKAE